MTTTSADSMTHEDDPARFLGSALGPDSVNVFADADPTTMAVMLDCVAEADALLARRYAELRVTRESHERRAALRVLRGGAAQPSAAAPSRAWSHIRTSG